MRKSVAAIAVLVVSAGSLALAQPALTASPPGAPTITSMTSNPTTATISWQAPTSDGGSPITIYVATAVPLVSTNATRSCATTGATTCTIGDLVNGAMYSVTVAAGNPTLGPASAQWFDSPIGHGTAGLSGQPQITSITPAYGPKKGGTRVTIRGTGLSSATKVTFNGAKGTNLVVVNPGEIKVTTPTSATGPARLWVKTPQGKGMSQAYVFVE